MRDRPWRSLATSLKRDAVDTTYRDRVTTRVDPEAAQLALEAEIVQEMASALGRAERKVLDAIAQLDAAAVAIDAAPGPLEELQAIDAFNARRKIALAARYELRVHRDAIGLRGRYDDIERRYPIPPARRW